MQQNLMQLKVLLPFKIFTEKDSVTNIIVKTNQGFLGLLPNRLDCVAVLTPGILSWQNGLGGETVIAVDDGILVKVGTEVLISVRNAIGGKDIKALHEAVTQEFIKESEDDKALKLIMSKLESGFVHRFAELQNG